MARSPSKPTRLEQFAALGARRRGLLLEAAVWLLLARAALIFLSFPRIASHLGAFMAPSDPRAGEASAVSDPGHPEIARQVSWAVTRAAAHVPFEAVCLPQAMAARLMLQRRGVASVLHFGAAKGKTRPLDAHAWLDAAGVKVTGFPVARACTEIACFV
jgi:hypothetical protein